MNATAIPNGLADATAEPVVITTNGIGEAAFYESAGAAYCMKPLIGDRLMGGRK